eukprot:10922358-Lingulodinium_polyedra.AAC.2
MGGLGAELPEGRRCRRVPHADAPQSDVVRLSRGRAGGGQCVRRGGHQASAGNAATAPQTDGPPSP